MYTIIIYAKISIRLCNIIIHAFDASKTFFSHVRYVSLLILCCNSYLDIFISLPLKKSLKTFNITCFLPTGLPIYYLT